MVIAIAKIYMLKRDQFYDNEYLQKYLDLIDGNQERKQEKYRTNIHHVVPKHVFKKSGLSYDDSPKNKINLLYKDHILAHYYLYMCAKDKQCKDGNDKAIRCLVNYNWTKDPDKLLNSLDSLQEEYEKKMLKRSIVLRGKQHES